jgi:hypothetical protein
MAYVPFASIDPAALRWLRTSTGPLGFELSSSDRSLGRLAWARPSGTLATWTTAAGSTSLKRVGFLHPRLTARVGTDPRDVAQVSVHLNYHRIELGTGTRYRFHRAGLLVPAWKLLTDSGEELLHVEPIRDGRALAGGAVIASPAAVHLEDLPLLVALAWYVIVLSWFEDEALVPFEGPDVPPAAATKRD